MLSLTISSSKRFTLSGVPRCAWNCGKEYTYSVSFTTLCFVYTFNEPSDSVIPAIRAMIATRGSAALKGRSPDTVIAAAWASAIESWIPSSLQALTKASLVRIIRSLRSTSTSTAHGSRDTPIKCCPMTKSFTWTHPRFVMK